MLLNEVEMTDYLPNPMATDRAAIVRAAVDLIKEGEASFSRRKLAERAGVSTARLNMCFRSLSDLKSEMQRLGLL